VNIVYIAYGFGSWFGWGSRSFVPVAEMFRRHANKTFSLLGRDTRARRTRTTRTTTVRIQDPAEFGVRICYLPASRPAAVSLCIFSCSPLLSCIVLVYHFACHLAMFYYYFSLGIASHHVMHTCLCTWLRSFVLSPHAMSFFCCCYYCDATWPLFCTHCSSSLSPVALGCFRCELQSAFPFSI